MKNITSKYRIFGFLLVQISQILISIFVVRYGVKPEWLMIHRIINHRTFKDGRTTYLVKWRDLPYDQATWEEETKDIPNFKKAIEYYWVNFFSIETYTNIENFID